MWTLVNQIPFVADGAFQRDARGAEFWCSAVAATFRPCGDWLCEIEPDEQVRLVPDFGGGGGMELRHDADLSPFRPRTDVTLIGDAVAPSERAAATIDIALHLGKLDRRVQARAPSRLIKKRWGWGVETGDPVARVATGWSMALGGRDQFTDDAICATNPLGKGWFRDLSRATRGDSVDLPQLCLPDDQFDHNDPLPAPVGIGLVHPAWDPRRQLSGRYDAEWRDTVAPLLPADFDGAFYQAAPQDQIYPGFVVSGEQVRLDGMHATGTWAFRLPQIILAQNCRIDGKSESTRMNVVSVRIDAAAGLVRMVWNAATRCTGRDHLLDRTTIRLVQMSGVA